MMVLAAVVAQWADAVTFAAIAAVTADLSGEVSPVVAIAGPGVALLAKAGVMAALVALQGVRGHRILAGWAAALGAIGTATNVWYMIGGAS